MLPLSCWTCSVRSGLPGEKMGPWAEQPGPIFKNRFKGASATRSRRSIGRDMRWWCDPSPDGTLWLNPIFPKNVFFRKRRFLPKAVAIPQGWVGIEGLNPMKPKCGYSFWKLPEAPNLQSLVVCLSLAQRNNFQTINSCEHLARVTFL